MKISAITVCYNSEATIRHTLDSFFEQDHYAKEIIVVDGASKDGTVDIVKSYASDQLRLVSEADKGMYDALNKGLALYSGDAFGVLNSDDAYHDSTVLSRIAGALENNDVVHGHLDFVDDHVNKRVARRWRATEAPSSKFRSGWMPAHPTFYVRRHVAKSVGPFDLSLKVAADYDWMLRAVELHDFKVGLVEHVLIDMMQGGKSTSGLLSQIGHNLEALRSRRRWLGAKRVDYALFAKPVRKVGQFMSRMRA